MSVIYDESFFIATVGPTLAADYKEANRHVGDDDAWVVWPARVEADIAAGMNQRASLAKHRIEWRTSLGLNPNPNPTPPIPPSGGGVPNLRIDGRQFVTDAGLWSYRGFTDFSLAKRLHDGEDIRQILRSRKALGANEVRVLMDLNFGPDWRYEPDPDTRDDILHALLTICEREGLFVEPIFFGNHEVGYYGNIAQHHERLFRLSDVCSGHKNAVPECWNEYDHGPAPADPNELSQPSSLMISHGSGTADVDPMPPFWTHSTFHPGRSVDWPRKMKSAMEFETASWKPCKVNEPMGADETPTPGRRDTDPNNFYDAAATAALLTQGALFHSQAGLRSEALGPVQQECAEAFFRGLSDVPVQARQWSYTRGGLSTCPVVHDDTKYSRLFVMQNDVEGWGIAVQASADWRLLPLRGQVTERRGPHEQVFHLQF